MTTLTIGRFSMSDGPSAIRHDGDFLELELQIDAATTSTPAEAKVKRQQLLGMVDNPDESAFPLTFSDDSDLDGFYTVLSVQCEPFEMFLNNGTMGVSVSLRRVANGYQNPTVETTLVSRLATNSHSVTSSAYALAASWRNADSDLYDLNGLFTDGGSSETLTAIDGTSVTVFRVADTDISGYWTLYARPDTYYSPPACKIEYKVGSTWYELTGRQIPANVAWRISNGIVRIGTLAAPPQANMTIEVADTSAWVGREITDTYVTFGGEAGPFVVRNSPEAVSIKVQTFRGIYSTISVWRGGVFALIASTQGSSSALDIGVKLASGVAGTNVTGGIRMTSNDANGNRLVLLSRSTVTTNTTSTGLYVTTPSEAVFAVGFNFGANGPGSFYSEVGMLEALCSPPQWRQRIAAR